MKVKNISSKKIILGKNIIYPNQTVNISINDINLIDKNKLKIIKPLQNSIDNFKYLKEQVTEVKQITEVTQTISTQTTEAVKISEPEKITVDNSNIENLLHEIINLLKSNSIQINKPIEKEPEPQIIVETKKEIAPTGDDDMDSFLLNLLENSDR